MTSADKPAPPSNAAAANAPDSLGAELALQRNALVMIKQKTAILIDPNPASRTALRGMLSSIGMTRVLQAAGSADALRRLRENPCEIILCDYMLEDGRDGQQLLEEMRSTRLIPLSTVFIIITRERRYQSVVSVAELAPDDYLLKPFTPQHLLERLEAVLDKKWVFRIAHAQIEAGDIDAALVSCDAIFNQVPPYRLDALRLKAETLMAAKRSKEAEALYRQILAFKAVPWAKMGLAVVIQQAGELEEAADLVVDIIRDHPQYLAAYDLAAKIEAQRGRSKEAQTHLQNAVQHAPLGLSRQRHLGRVALQNGDFETAERALSTVISRGAGTSLREIADYSMLARTQMESGKADAALETVAALSRDMRGNAEATLTSDAMTALAHAKLGNAEQSLQAAKRALSRIDTESTSTGMLLDVSQALLVAGEREAGEKLLQKAMSLGEGDSRFNQYMQRTLASFQETADVAERVGEDMRQRLIQINNEGVRLGQEGHFDQAIEHFREAVAKLPSVQMFANAAKAILAKLNRDGWDRQLASEARSYLQRGLGLSADDPRIKSALAAFVQIGAKFGVGLDDL